MKETNIQEKKLLILGADIETIPLVETANSLQVKTIVTSTYRDAPAKKIAWKSFNVNELDVPALISLAREERIDGVLAGASDSVVPAYCKVCDALDLPCYATEEIVKVFSYKDIFKATFERYGIHGTPEYFYDKDQKNDLDIDFPVMVKPVDGYNGIGMTVCYSEDELPEAIDKALNASHAGRYIIERYMECDDVGIYYTFKDGECELSCIFDRYTSTEQKNVSRVSLGGIYPSKHIYDYFERMHDDAIRLFKAIGIKNGVLLLQAFYEEGEFYVYDTGFRLQGEAPNILMKELNGIKQTEMLVRYALTASEGGFKLKDYTDPYFGGKYAATLWFLLKEGTIKRIEGLNEVVADRTVIFNGQRLREGDTVLSDWLGTEKQVMTRLYIICSSKQELADKITDFRNRVRVFDTDGNRMLLSGFNIEKMMSE